MSDEPNYEHNYESAVWPEKSQPTLAALGKVNDLEGKWFCEWAERILLALQGIDLSLDKLSGTGPSESDKTLAELIEARGKLDE